MNESLQKPLVNIQTSNEQAHHIIQEMRDQLVTLSSMWGTMKAPDKINSIHALRRRFPTVGRARFIECAANILSSKTSSAIDARTSIQLFLDSPAELINNKPETEKITPPVSTGLFSDEAKEYIKSLSEWDDYDLKEKAEVVAIIIDRRPRKMSFAEAVGIISNETYKWNRTIGLYWTLSQMPNEVWQLAEAGFLTDENLKMFIVSTRNLSPSHFITLVEQLMILCQDTELSEELIGQVRKASCKESRLPNGEGLFSDTIRDYINALKKWDSVTMKERAELITLIIKNRPDELEAYEAIAVLSSLINKEDRIIPLYQYLYKMPNAVWQLTELGLVTDENLRFFVASARSLKPNQLELFIENLANESPAEVLSEEVIKKTARNACRKKRLLKADSMKKKVEKMMRADIVYVVIPSHSKSSRRDYVAVEQPRLKWVPFETPGYDDYMEDRDYGIADGHVVFYEEANPTRKYILHFESVQPFVEQDDDDEY